MEAHKPLFLLVRLVGFEPTTYGLEVRCSIQLSYRRTLFSYENYVPLFLSKIFISRP